MPYPYPTEWPQFFTATIRNWMPLLASDQFKDIIVDSLKFMVKENRIRLNAFAPIAIGVNNHIHLIWQPLGVQKLTSIQLSFMKFTAQQIKFFLEKNNPALLEQCRVNKTDRQYQIWKRKPLSTCLPVGRSN